MQIKMRVRKTGQLKNLALTTKQYRELGDAMLAANKQRIGRGINVMGAPAKPLHPKYRKIKAKIRHTARPLRDMRLTGFTMDSYRVIRAWGGIIRAEPLNPEARKRAFFAQKLEPMFGFTPYEEKKVVAAARRMFGRNAQLIWEQH